MSKLNKLISGLIIFFLLASHVNAQYASTKVMTKHQAYTDSLKQVEYKYTFPILGQEAYRKGFDIPYPIGFMTNFMVIDQRILLDNFKLGLKTDEQDIPLTDVDFIGFGDNTNIAYTANVRPDIWIFPFLNVYGIFGYGHSRTVININRLAQKPFDLQSIAEQGISTAGFGVMAAGGIGPVWFSVDGNWTWNKPELVDKPTQVNVLGVRMGHTFVFKNNPDSNIAVWIGGMRVKMGSETNGEIRLGDAIPNMNEKGNEIIDFYNNLPPKDKIKPKYLVLKAIGERMAASDGDAIIRYGMDKQVKEMWNGLLGAQYQINKHWQIRTEGGVIGDRKSFLFSVNYRILGF
jgi:hypothetical protein